MENKLGLDLQGADNASQFSVIYNNDESTIIVVDESIDLSTITGLSDLLNCSSGEISIVADPTPDTLTLPLNIEHAESQSIDYGQNECKSSFILEQFEDQSKQVISETKIPNQSFQEEPCTFNKPRNFNFQIIQPSAKKSYNVCQERSIEHETFGEINNRPITSEVTVQNSWTFPEFENKLGIEDGEKDTKMFVKMAETNIQMESQKFGDGKWSNAEVSIKSEKEKKTVTFAEEINNIANDKHLFKISEAAPEDIKEKAINRGLDVEKTSCHGNRFNPQYGRGGKEESNSQTYRHEERRRFKCTLCTQSFDTVELLMKHRARDHFLSGKKLSFDCTICGRSFKSVTSLHLHKRIHKRDGPVKCNKCAAQFTLKGSLLKHIPLCGSPEERKRVLKNKQRILREKRQANKNQILHVKTNIDYKCFLCNKCFLSQHALATHKTRVHKIIKPKTDKKGLKGFHVLDLEKCSESEKENLSFSRNEFWNVNHIVSETDWKKSLRKDQFRINKDLESKQSIKINCIETNKNSLDLTKGKVFQCLYCRQCFRDAREVKKHVTVHRTICSDCGKKALDLPRLRRHRLSVHNSMQDGIFDCPHCKKKYGGVSYLLRHMKDHVGPWVCERETCLAQFSERSNLVAHRKSHGNPYPDQSMTLFDGTVSEKDMKGLTLLTIDDFIEKPETFTETSIGRVLALVKCKICREQFASTTITRKHIKMVHLRNSMKKFQCGQCDFSANFGYIIKRHQKIHSREFVCNICSKSFDTKSKLDNHLSYHNKDRYQCYYCGKQFISRKKCIDHIDTNHRDRKKQNVTLESNPSFDEQSDVTLKDRVEEEIVKSAPHMGESPPSYINDKDQTNNQGEGGAKLQKKEELQADNAYGSRDDLLEESDTLDTDIEMAHLAENEYGRNSIENRKEEIHNGTLKSDLDLENVTYIDSCGQPVPYIPQKNEKTYSITPQTIQVPNSDVTLELYEDGTIVTKDTQGTNFSAINFESLGIDLGTLDGKTDIEFIIAQADGTEVKATIQADIDRSSDVTQEVTKELKHNKDDVKLDKKTSISDVQNLELHKEQEVKISKGNKGVSDLTCSKCGKVFDVAYKLNRHISSAHGLKRGYACPYCGRVFRLKSEVQAHVKVHVGPFECSFCLYERKTHEELLDHVREEHAFKTFICPICKAECGCRGRFKEHVKREHSMKAEGSLLKEAFRVYKCNDCDANFEIPSQLIGHQQTHAGKKQFACSFCIAEFYSKSKMNEHLRLFHWEHFKKIYSYIGDEFLIREDLAEKKTSERDNGSQTQNQDDKTSEFDAIEVSAIETPGVAVHNNGELGSSATISKPENRQHSFTKHLNLVKSEMQVVSSDLKTEEPTDQVMCDHCGLYFLHLKDLKQHLQDQGQESESYVEIKEDCTALADRRATADLTASDKVTVCGESKEYQCERKFEQQPSHEVLTEPYDKGLGARIGDESLNDKLREQKVKVKAKRGRKPKAKMFPTLKADRDDKLDLPRDVLKQNRMHDSSKSNGRASKDDIVSFLGENFNLREASSTLEEKVKPKPHKCFVCGERFNRESVLLKHTKRHSEDADIDDKIKKENNIQPLVFKCEECGNMYATCSGLASHVRQKHPGITLPANISKVDNSCITEFADKKISNKTSKEKGRTLKEVKGRYKYSLSKLKKADKHKALIWKDRQGNYPCTICKAVYRNYIGILYHLKNRHPVKFSKQQTQLSPTKVSTSGRVIKKSHKTFDQIQCEICFKQFSFESYLIKHMQNKHSCEDDVLGTKNKNSFCKLCNKSFKKLGIHMYHKHAKSCISGKDKSDLGAQKNSVCDIMERKGVLYESAICQSGFQTQSELHKHVPKHGQLNRGILIEKQKKVFCEISKERLKTSLDLNGRRTGERRKNGLKNVKQSRVKNMIGLDRVTDCYKNRLMLHKCKVCHKSFESRQLLTKHKLRCHSHHSDIVKYDRPIKQKATKKEEKMTCNICNISFYRKRHLLEHMLSHTSIQSGRNKDLHKTAKKKPKGADKKKSVMLRKNVDLQNRRNKMKEKKGMRQGWKGAKSRFNPGTDSSLIRKADLKCSMCTKLFINEFNLHVHMFHVHKKIAAKSKRRFCTICKTLFKTDLNYTKHMNTLHGKVATGKQTVGEIREFFKCEECGEKVRTSKGLKIHNRRIHGHSAVAYNSAMRQECVMCLECQQLYKSEIEYKEHLKQFHAVVKDVDEELKGEISHPVDGIKMEIADEDAVESTFTADKPGGSLVKDAETEFQCNICNDVLTTKDDVKKHAHCHYRTEEDDTEFQTSEPESSVELSSFTSKDDIQSEDQACTDDNTGSAGKTYSEIYPVSCMAANVDVSLLNYEKLFGVPVVQLRRLDLPSESADYSEDDSHTIVDNDVEDNAESFLETGESDERNDQSTILSDSFGTADTELELEIDSDLIGDEDKTNNCEITTANNFEEESCTLSNDVEDHAESLLNTAVREQKANQLAVILDSFGTREAELESNIKSDSQGEEGKENNCGSPNETTIENEGSTLTHDIKDNVDSFLDSLESDQKVDQTTFMSEVCGTNDAKLHLEEETDNLEDDKV